MGNFSNNAITDVGKMLLADVQAGAIFTPTRIVMGSGSMPSGATAESMNDVITPVVSLAINKKKRTPDGKCVFGGVFSNEDVLGAFYFRELALYAKAVYLNADGTVRSEGAETLYSYGNAGTTADYIPAYSTSTVVEKQMDLVTWVGNDAEVDLTIESGVFVTRDQVVLNYPFISPAVSGWHYLLDYIGSLDSDTIISGKIVNFSDMPEDARQMHGTISTAGGIYSVFGYSDNAFYYRGTTSLTEWTSEWHKIFDTGNTPTPSEVGAVALSGDTMTGDLIIDKAIAAVKLKTAKGSANFFKNANTANDLGTTISDVTADGVTDRVILSAARSIVDKLRLVTHDGITHYILHTGNKDLVKPADIGAVNKDGDTMSGDLLVKKSAGPAVHIVEENGAGGAVQLWNNVLSLSNKNSAEDLNNYRLLSLANAKSEADIVHALVLSDVTNGVQKYYTVLHAGNMAAFGLGAVPASVE